jgi:hypothetical protein
VGEDDSPNVREVPTLSDALVRMQEFKEKGSELEEENSGVRKTGRNGKASETK